MEWKKVKWLIISVLLGVNLFLGLNIAVRYSREIIQEKNALKTAVSLAPTDMGFEIGLFEHLPLYMYSYYGSRDTGAEDQLAALLLGTQRRYEQVGGGVNMYLLETREQLLFRAGGEIEGIVASSGADINIVFDTLDMFYKKNNGRTLFYFDSYPVCNTSFRAEILGTYMSISGRIPLCNKWNQWEKCRSRSEIAIALMQTIRENSLGRLEEISAVYYLKPHGTDNLILVPSWQARCSNGTVILSLTDKSALDIIK